MLEFQDEEEEFLWAIESSNNDLQHVAWFYIKSKWVFTWIPSSRHMNLKGVMPLMNWSWYLDLVFIFIKNIEYINCTITCYWMVDH